MHSGSSHLDVYPYILALLVALGCAPFTGAAQYHVGVFAGNVATEFSGIKSDQGRFGFQVGYTVGAQFDYYVEQDVALSVGVALQDERGKLSLLDDSDPENTFFVDSFNLSIKQLLIPLTFRVITNNERWHFIGGLSANIPLSLRAITKIDFNGDDLLQGFGLGYLTGIGFRFKPASWGTLHLEARYSQSLMALTNSEEPVLSGLKSSHSTFAVLFYPPFLRR